MKTSMKPIVVEEGDRIEDFRQGHLRVDFANSLIGKFSRQTMLPGTVQHRVSMRHTSQVVRLSRVEMYKKKYSLPFSLWRL